MASKQALVDYARKTLQTWFEESGFSQQQVADRMGWKQQTSVSQYFNERSDLSLDQVAEMAVILGHSVAELVNGWTQGKAAQQTELTAEEAQLVMACRRASVKVRPALLVLANAATEKGRGK